MTLRNIARRLALGVAAGAVLVAGAARAADDQGSVQGVVNDAGGKPVANRLEPGKRPMSAMSPTLVYGKDGKLQYVTFEME